MSPQARMELTKIVAERHLKAKTRAEKSDNHKQPQHHHPNNQSDHHRNHGGYIRHSHHEGKKDIQRYVRDVF